MIGLYILLGVIAVAAVLLLVLALRPAEFQIRRSASYAVPAATLFPYVNNLHLFQEWSPWARRDPDMNSEFSGPNSGEGAIYRWNGNKDVGQGSMTITQSKLNELVVIRLEFLKPFAATHTTEFILQDAGNQTELIWNMTGRNNLIGKLFDLLINMDKMIGKDFEEGFENLRMVLDKK